MPQTVKQFSGFLDTDSSNEVMPSVYHKMAYNGRFRGVGNQTRFEGVEGNVVIPNSYLPAVGNNECIGSFTDSVKQRLIWFNYNSEGYNGIYWLDLKTGVVSRYFQSFVNSATDILNFDLDYPIPSVNIIYATDDIGDTLCWTDRTNRPMKLNLKQAVDNTYGAEWTTDYLTVARSMPLICPSCRYQNDSAVLVNNLRKTLYEFRYKYVYRDNTESCWSPYSKLFAPLDPDSLATNVDPTKNNRIDVSLNTGAADCTKIKIAARSIIGADVFSDDFLVATLDKSALGINNDSLYTYQFYNDSSYPFINVADATLLFDYVPKKANTQELLNGNVVVYGGITEGVNFNVTLDIGSDVTLFDNGEEPMSIQSYNSGRQWSFIFFGTPVTGDTVTLNVTVTHDDGSFDLYVFIYTVLIGDTLQDVVDAFKVMIDAQVPLTATLITPDGGTGFRIFSSTLTDIVSGEYIINYSPATSSTDDVSNSVYKHKSKYRFGLVYFDEFGVTNGVQTVDDLLVTTLEMDTTGGTKMKVNNISFSVHNKPPMGAYYFTWVRALNLTVANFTTFVSASTAKSGTGTTDFGFIEITNLQTNQNNFPTYSFTEGDRIRIIGKFVNGAAGTVSVLDFPIVALVTDPTIATAVVTGDFIKVPYNSSLSTFGTDMHYYCEVYTPAVSTSLNTQVFYEFGETYQVVNPNTTDRSHKGKRQNQVDGTVSSITAPATAATATLNAVAGSLSIGAYSYYIEYANAAGELSSPSPLSNIITTVSGSQRINLSVIPISTDPLVTSRKIYRTKADGSTYYLLATIADNTTTTYADNIADSSLTVVMPQPAIFDFARGDVYIRDRQFPITANLQTINKMWLVNRSVSDLYPSTIVGNGRAWIIDPFAVETYYSTLLRWGLDYEVNTNINQINKFYPLNQNTVDLMKGDIQRFMVEDRLLYVYQNRAVGQFGIYARFIQNNSGQSQLVTTNDILTSNNINYIEGEYGLGDQYCGLVRSKNAHYFADPVRGANIRRAGNGLTNLSEKYKGQYYIKSLITPYNKTWTRPNGSKAKILGFYNFIEEECNTILQGGINSGDEIANYTFSFNEIRNGYCNFYQLYPEWAASANDVIYAWKNGQIYSHTNTTQYCNFFGVQYYPSITLVFNENEGVKKNFNALAYQSNRIWECPEIGDIYTSMVDGQTGVIQESKLPNWAVEVDENKRIAALLRDVNSMPNPQQALIEGNYLQGFNIVINLVYLGSEYSWLYLPYISWTLNNRQF